MIRTMAASDRNQVIFFKRFGVTVRKMREEAGLTLEDMQEYGFSPQHFQKIEAGKKFVNFYTVFRIAKAFNHSMGHLIEMLD